MAGRQGTSGVPTKGLKAVLLNVFANTPTEWNVSLDWDRSHLKFSIAQKGKILDPKLGKEKSKNV